MLAQSNTNSHPYFYFYSHADADSYSYAKTYSVAKAPPQPVSSPDAVRGEWGDLVVAASPCRGNSLVA